MSLASLLGLGPGERGSLGGKSLPQYMNSLQNFLTVVPAPPRNRRLRGNSYLTPRANPKPARMGGTKAKAAGSSMADGFAM